LPLLQELGDRIGEAGTWDSIAYAHHHLGHHAQAVACYQNTLTHLGDTHHAAGQSDAARTAWQHALSILDDLHHPTPTTSAPNSARPTSPTSSGRLRRTRSAEDGYGVGVELARLPGLVTIVAAFPAPAK
jgi:hypothetical protein